MERDADAQEKIKELQRDIIVLLKMRYGDVSNYYLILLLFLHLVF